MQHYSELQDVKRVIVNTHAIEPQVWCALVLWMTWFLDACDIMSKYVLMIQALVEFFGTLSKEWALECMKDLLLVNLRGNLQIIVQVNVLLYVFLLLYIAVRGLICRCAGCQRILWAIGYRCLHEALWAVQILRRAVFLFGFISEFQVLSDSKNQDRCKFSHRVSNAITFVLTVRIQISISSTLKQQLKLGKLKRWNV